ncbi:hypothetical protein A9P82_02280 [Arachidicoccus ginsenosidimutans]|uniref:putative polyvalent protein kinase domain-containing protein n=1 Tax=Arachidicoccus sp. BS20 TaxID=1850526 RepID=UPI0007F1749D|nr:hypothetical protein [Arachidicoccus sp. BS20]ANI88232.1 hypothetical protein A9P82_02280 [Arachidicoccus sp. BS20]
MKKIKDELQNIIFGNGEDGSQSQLKAAQNFLRRNAQTGFGTEKQKHLKSEEEIGLIAFAHKEDLFYTDNISENDFISSGAEQRVYRYNDNSVIKLNDSIFYEYWLDYFNSLLIHNYFFQSTAYTFLGFTIKDNNLFAVVKQDFIIANENTHLDSVKQFLAYNGFRNTRNNDYFNNELGLIFEDLHDENVLSKNGILYFIDTVFYLTKEFYP